ncbi:hypothetical protein [Streptomyces sp. NPDC014734]|uniref:baeRF3 domain-containing protein n=1 Tax=Streptomyces sp. NPDC014734 TaxID=3364886 RepID=UPI0036F8DDB0
MRTSDLTPAVLKDLRRPRPFPAISLLMPTHRTRPDNEQDPIRLRNLLGEAARRVREDPSVDRESRLRLERQLDESAVLRLFDAQRAEDGLLVLLAPDDDPQAWQFCSPHDVPERIEVTDTFLTRNLVAAHLFARPYWVLVLDQEESRLYLAHAGNLTEATGHGFPAQPQVPSREDAIPGPAYGTERTGYRAERIAQYVTDIEERFTRAMSERRLPLVLVGSPELTTAFEKVSRHTGATVGRLDLTGADKHAVPQLEQRLAPVFEKIREDRAARAREELDAARGRKAYVAGLAEVWNSVMGHRAALVLVEEGLRAAGRADENHQLHIVDVPPGEPAPEGVETDIVDSLIEEALDADTEVRFVPDGTLPDGVGIAGALRY